jgi:hypothetical protein
MMARRHIAFDPSCCLRGPGFFKDQSVQAEASMLLPSSAPENAALENVLQSLPGEFRVHPGSGSGGYHYV